jgi:hypothetical protein
LLPLKAVAMTAHGPILWERTNWQRTSTQANKQAKRETMTIRTGHLFYAQNLETGRVRGGYGESTKWYRAEASSLCAFPIPASIWVKIDCPSSDKPQPESL